MRFMIIGRATKESEAGVLPKPEAFAAMQEYNEQLVKAGVLLAAEGLSASSKGARVKFSGNKRIVIDGPFTETKELVGGYAIMDCESDQEALDIAMKFMDLHREHWPEFEGESEVRPFEEGEPGSE